MGCSGAACAPASVIHTRVRLHLHEAEHRVQRERGRGCDHRHDGRSTGGGDGGGVALGGDRRAGPRPAVDGRLSPGRRMVDTSRHRRRSTPRRRWGSPRRSTPPPGGGISFVWTMVVRAKPVPAIVLTATARTDPPKTIGGRRPLPIGRGGVGQGRRRRLGRRCGRRPCEGGAVHALTLPHHPHQLRAPDSALGPARTAEVLKLDAGNPRRCSRREREQRAHVALRLTARNVV